MTSDSDPRIVPGNTRIFEAESRGGEREYLVHTKPCTEKAQEISLTSDPQ